MKLFLIPIIDANLVNNYNLGNTRYRIIWYTEFNVSGNI